MNILSATPTLGIVFLVLIFAVCFACVHIARLVQFGLKYRSLEKNKSETPPAPPPEKKAPAAEKPQEPIYYIVEKKRRAKTTFSEPKQINFK